MKVPRPNITLRKQPRQRRRGGPPSKNRDPASGPPERRNKTRRTRKGAIAEATEIHDGNLSSNGQKTAGEDTLQSPAKLTQSTITSIAHGNQQEEEDLVVVVEELRKKLRESEKKSEARKRSAVSYQTKYQELQKDFQESQLASARQEEGLRASFAEELRKTCADLVADWERKRRESDAESKAQKQSIVSYQTKCQTLQNELKEVQTVLKVERERRSRQEQEMHETLRELRMEFRESLERSQAKLREKEAEIQTLTASLKRSEMLRPSSKSTDSSKKMVKLQRELQETQRKLVLEKKKSAPCISTPVTERQKGARTKPELKDWIGPHVGGKTIKILKPGDLLDKDTDEKPRAATASSSTAAPRSRSQLAESINQESAPISFCGMEDEASTAMNTGDNRLEDELAFLASAYSNEEIELEDGKITRLLKLDAGGDGDQLTVGLTAGIPEGYPESGTLNISAALIVDNGPCNKEAWKCAEKSLQGLVDVCTWEAQGCASSEALLSVLNVADDWVQTQWNAVHARRFISSSSKRSTSESIDEIEVCCLLVYTHHIVDPDKIHFVKQTASKHDLGGLIKIGRPGLIAVEGLEANCDAFLSAIILQRKKMRASNKGKPDSSTFAEAGRAISGVRDIDSGRRLPRKIVQLENSTEGMDHFKAACAPIGLETHVEEACKR